MTLTGWWGELTFFGSTSTHCPPTLSSCGTRYDIPIPPSSHPGSVDNRTIMEVLLGRSSPPSSSEESPGLVTLGDIPEAPGPEWVLIQACDCCGGTFNDIISSCLKIMTESEGFSHPVTVRTPQDTRLERDPVEGQITGFVLGLKIKSQKN